MKTVLGFALLVALGGCHWGGLHREKAGSGKTKLEKRDVPAFTAVNISGGYEVEIVAQQEPKVEIEADDNLLSLIKTEVSGGVLTISNESGFSTKNTPHVRISVRQLDGISASGASEIVASNVKSDEFGIDISGASNLKVSGEARTFELGMSGASKVDAKDLHAENVSVTSSGASNADVYATGELRVSASGAGDISYYGDPKNVSQDASGAVTISKR